MPLPRIRREFMTSLRRLKETIKRTTKSSKRERETPLQIERLEERQMLAGDLVTIFQTSFEEISVEPGGFKFTQEVGGFEATGRSVELQNNHPSVGPASDGQNLLELDGVNGIAVEIDNVPPAGMILRVDYSPRPGIGATQNTVEVLWNGTLIESISDNGRKKKTKSTLTHCLK